MARSQQYDQVNRETKMNIEIEKHIVSSGFDPVQVFIE